MATTDLTISLLIGQRWIVIPRIQSVMGFGQNQTTWKERHSPNAYIECVVDFRTETGLKLLNASFSQSPIKTKYESKKERKYYWFSVHELRAISGSFKTESKHRIFAIGDIRRACH